MNGMTIPFLFPQFMVFQVTIHTQVALNLNLRNIRATLAATLVRHIVEVGAVGGHFVALSKVDL